MSLCFESAAESDQRPVVAEARAVTAPERPADRQHEKVIQKLYERRMIDENRTPAPDPDRAPIRIDDPGCTEGQFRQMVL
ncbi:hypothetical protein [Natronococcus jeotgali]|uniref:Uncharacterized protein n=1 Tax=Natronococcus jeotgali DSM 18795 TaxID=1227498 RepID=L9XBB2_9EURY|nr:hypothetical protein [Natronococcus jeotgali]ELY58731.1 hypothetical protein C492_11600 [Natronococcus jeotgali DSM 18795]